MPFGTADGNIDLDPQFRDEPNGDLRLLKTSPAIDRGETPPIPNDSRNADEDSNFDEKVPDVALRRRVFDLPSAPDGGIGDDCGTVDIGAHEYVITGDLNNDGVLNGLDIQPFARCWVAASVTGPCEEADLVTDGLLDFADVNCLIANLLGESPCTNDCPPGPGFGGGEEGGGGEPQGMSGGEQQAGSPLAPQNEGGDDEEVEDPAFNARWDAFVEWLEAHWIDQYPNMTDEEWNAWTLGVEIDMVYEGVSPW